MARLVAIDDIPKGARLVAVDDEPPAEPFGKRVNREVADIPRQLGLTARYGLEGIGSIPEIIGNAMEGAGIKGAGGNFGTTVANKLGLPVPESQIEKIVSHPSRLMAGAGGVIGGANKLANVVSESARPVLSSLAANPGLQVSSAAGAGGAGGYVKETGGDDLSQFLASVAGGIAAPASVSAMSSLPQRAAILAKRGVEFLAPGLSQPTTLNVDVVINNALQNSGLNLAQIPQGVLANLRNDVAQASQLGQLSPDALRRLVDYRLVGATPLRGNLTLNPVELTREKNLAKIAANSSDSALQPIVMRENANNNTLIEGLNGLGASTQDDAISAAQRVINTLQRNNEAAQGVINNAYSQARGTSGRSAALDPSYFANTANNLLDESMLGGKLPADVRNLLNRAATGDMPLTVDVAEQFKTRIGALQRASTDPAERMALGQVRQALDSTPLLEGQGQEAIDAFNRARRINRTWMDVVDRTPALQAVRDGVEPDKFVNQFIIGNGNSASVMSVAQLRNLIRNSPESMAAIRGQIASFIKDKATSGASDEVGKVSQSALNKAIESIGERKLAMFFQPDEIARLRALGRVASYEQVQPVGSAVNNSNTSGATIGTMLDKLSRMPLLGKIPMGQQLVGQPLQNITAGLNASRATNIPASLIMPMQRKPSILPSAVVPGLLSTQE